MSFEGREGVAGMVRATIGSILESVRRLFTQQASGREEGHERRARPETRRISWSAAGGDVCNPRAEKTGEAVRNREVGTRSGAWQLSTGGDDSEPEQFGERSEPWSGRTRSLPRAGSDEVNGGNPRGFGAVDGGMMDRSMRREVHEAANSHERKAGTALAQRGPAHKGSASKWSPR